MKVSHNLKILIVMWFPCCLTLQRVNKSLFYLLQHLRKLNNFNSYLAILSALDSAPIRRLEWQKQTSEVRGLWECCSLFWLSRSVIIMFMDFFPHITLPPHFSLRDWRNIAHWLTVPPPSEHTELLWLRWSLHASRTCKWMNVDTHISSHKNYVLFERQNLTHILLLPGVSFSRTWPLSTSGTRTSLTGKSTSPNAGSSSTSWTACGASSKCKSTGINLQKRKRCT